jgi:hypothetical protein
MKLKIGTRNVIIQRSPILHLHWQHLSSKSIYMLYKLLLSSVIIIDAEKFMNGDLSQSETLSKHMDPGSLIHHTISAGVSSI